MLFTDVEAARSLGMARSTIWGRVRDGTMPPPIRRGTKWSRWPQSDVQRVEAAIVAGATDDELRALVRELLDQRAAGRPRAA